MKNPTIGMVSLCAFAIYVFIFLTSCLGAPPNNFPVIYFPPKTTDSGHAIGEKNLDWSLKPDNPKDAHDDYIRINRLRSYIDRHAGLFNQTDAWNALSLVAANASNRVEGALSLETIRLPYTDVADLSDLIMTARFYKRDGPVNNPAWNTRYLVLFPSFLPGHAVT